MVIAKHEVAEWDEVLFLSDTDRGEGGFGSTGKKIRHYEQYSSN